MATSLLKTGVPSNFPFRWFYLGRFIWKHYDTCGSGFAVLQARQGQDLLGYILAAESSPMF